MVAAMRGDRFELALIAMAGVLAVGCGPPELASIDAAAPDAASIDAASVDGADATRRDPFTLAPGEVAEVPVGSAVASLRLATPEGTERFVVVAASMQLAASAASSLYRVESGATVDFGPPSLVSGCSLDERRWRSMAVLTDASPAGSAPALGAQRTFRMPTETTVESVVARVAAVSEHAVLWVDVTPAHPATLDPAVVAALLRDFEETILPRERAVFGTESDVDGDGRVSLVFSPVTARSGDAFFWQCDLQLSLIHISEPTRPY